MKKRLLTILLALAMMVSLLTFPVSAEAGEESSAEENTSGTVAGEEETVEMNSIAITERETDFNDGWKFYLGNVSSAYTTTYDDSSWDDVTLPHDYSITQTFTTSGEAESGFLPGGTGWYRKTFTLSEEQAGSSIVINFDGVYSDAYVYVNGEYIGENHYGYTSFAFDITDYLVTDGTTENVIAVKVVNNIPSSRWYSGSGIYRDVTLIVTDEVHVAYNGTYVTTPNLEDSEGSDGTVDVEIELDNDGESDITVTVENTIYTDDDEAVSDTVFTTALISAGSSATVTAEPSVSNPDLWSTDDPNLYYVLTEIYVGDTLVDSYETEFGYRWYSFDEDDGFYLNGEALKLNGVCLHHDQGAAGSAAYYDAIYRQLSTLKDMGVNAIRTSHNPADEDFIDICNELGLLVIEEAFDGWSQSKNGNTYDFSQYFSTTLSEDNQIINGDSTMTWAEYAIKSMVKRDRNDPSVILWSLGNEITEGVTGSTSDYPEIAQNLIDWIEELDDTRQTTIGDNGRTTSSSSVLYQVDQVIVKNGGIVGINYGSSSQLSTMKNALGAIYSSETSSAVNSRGIYSGQTSNAASDDDYHITSYDTSAVSWGITAHESLWNTLTTDYVAGEFVWTGWDYIGEPTPWNGTSSGSVSGSGAVPNSSYFGIVDTAGFEKDTYYLYRSQWNQSSTTLHLVTAWDDDNICYTASTTSFSNVTTFGASMSTGLGGSYSGRSTTGTSSSASSNQTPVVIYSNAAKVELYLNDVLIGTATRTTHTTDAGHTYYTYSTSSNSSSVCTAVTGSDSTSLYATFNVTYTSGTIYAVAYDEEGNTITDTYGTSSVSTPDTVSQMEVTASTEEVDADGQSLIYIEVELQDSDGNLDTTAENEITFTVSGVGTILGVDNGDQSTTEKYQQSSVIDSETQAHIDAYAGKALVIVRSTQEAGTIVVSISADGMSTQTVTVTSNSVAETADDSDLVSYTMVRDYSIKAGTVPELLTSATVTLGSGETIEGTIVWEDISSDIYSTAGDYTITGTLYIDGYDAITVTATLHVIDDIVALRNVSTVTAEGVLPTLPTTVNGILADGTISGEFVVEWEEITEDQFEEADEIVTVSGTATIIGTESLDVTCTVRVAEAVNTESTNVATSAEVTQDIEESYQSDTLSSVNNGVTTFADDTSERWTNWNNRYNSDTAALTFTWSTAQLLESVNIYYYNDGCAILPEDVLFEYSLNGTDYVEIGYTEELIQTATYGWEYTYTFDEVINPIAVRITFTQQGGTTGGYCVGVIEVEMMTYAGSVESSSSAALSAIYVDGTAISGFDADTLSYEVTGDAVTSAETEDNAGITILPEYDGVVYILTISEDGSETKTYAVALAGETCGHENTTLVNRVEATCTEDGYTGDTVCDDCGETIAYGETIPAAGHSYTSEVTTEPTCTEHGVMTYTCTICGDTYSESVAAAGHSYELTSEVENDDGSITYTYTCSVCGESYTKNLSVPSVSLTVRTNGSKIQMVATMTGYNDTENYYEITGHGFVYITKTKLGYKTLTVSTTGRTKVTVNGETLSSDGMYKYAYSLTPASSSKVYVMRAWITYEDGDGNTQYVYSDAVSTSYSALS